MGCQEPVTDLPYLGVPQINGTDTTYPTIRNFEFRNQDSLLISDKNFEGKIYVADFIFLSCPTICPKMTAQMKRVYTAFKAEPNVMFLSHTIDPDRDDVARLRNYSDYLEIDSKKWYFVTGNKDSIYAIAEQSYYSTASVDSTQLGGLIHSGGLILVDKNRHVRGIYDGTKPIDTEKLILDLGWLLNDQFK